MIRSTIRNWTIIYVVGFAVAIFVAYELAETLR